MRLYYYTSHQYGIQSLTDKRIKIARFTELNDPFDWIGIATNGLEERRAIRKLRRKFDRTNGLLCMSTSWRVPLLWSHYAEKHKGICLGFDVPDNEWVQVDYVENRPTLDDYSATSATALTLDNIKDIMRKKGPDWAYEAEYRKFIPLRVPDLRTGIYFQPFSDEMKLVSVHVGERSTISKAWMKALVDYNGRDIEMMKVRSAFRTYSILPDAATNWK